MLKNEGSQSLRIVTQLAVCSHHNLSIMNSKAGLNDFMHRNSSPFIFCTHNEIHFMFDRDSISRCLNEYYQYNMANLMNQIMFRFCLSKVKHQQNIMFYECIYTSTTIQNNIWQCFIITIYCL